MSRFTLLAIALMALLSNAPAAEVLRWERVPLPLELIVGQERVVLVDRNVRIGVPSDVTDRLHVQSAGGALYLRADAPIESKRVQLQDAESGALIFLDVTAVRGVAGQPPLEPVRIQDTTHPPARSAEPSDDAEDSAEHRVKVHASSDTTPPTPIPVVLTRFAAQSLYAPLRTIEPVPGITAVRARNDLTLESLLPMLPIKAQWLAAWRLEDYWLTAIRLTHTEPGWLTLDPRLLQGDFYAATFQHTTLGPAGEASDTTVLYLITRGHALAGSLLPAISSVDAAPNGTTVPTHMPAEARHEK